MLTKKLITSVMRELGKRTSSKKKAASVLNGRLYGGRPPIKWSPVPGAPAPHFFVSTSGKVRNALTGRLIGHKNNKGYWKINMFASGKRVRMSVHTAVALAFLGPRPYAHEVNHKDGNKDNNSVKNLEYITHYENLQHAHKNGLICSKNNLYNAKLAAEDVQRIREEYRSTRVLHRELACRYGVSRSCISEILRNDSWVCPQKRVENAKPQKAPRIPPHHNIQQHRKLRQPAPTGKLHHRREGQDPCQG